MSECTNVGNWGYHSEGYYDQWECVWCGASIEKEVAEILRELALLSGNPSDVSRALAKATGHDLPLDLKVGMDDDNGRAAS
jgi:hypothetical protein